MLFLRALQTYLALQFRCLKMTVSVLEPLTCFAWDYCQKVILCHRAPCWLAWLARVLLQSWEPAVREISSVFQLQYVISHIGKILVILQMIQDSYTFSRSPQQSSCRNKPLEDNSPVSFSCAKGSYWYFSMSLCWT